ncbi:porin [Thiomicrorhabdus arctica]|uniref:porin n=1 Tax=Thiomicrorhabdus arctica TaxID=131540 RepID=UPI00036FF3C3|nr:porin [Thiomicrorhabdus arctica]
MKKNIIALAIASAVAAPVAFADAPTLYGQGYLSIDNLTDKGASVNSHSSRIGVKGSEDLGNGLKAVYKMEFGVNMTETNTSLSGRNAYVGLAGGFGTVLMGRNDTPFKMIQGKDLFNDATKSGYGDNKPMAGGLGIGGGEVRAEKVVAYVSPSFGGIKIIAAGVSGTNNTGNGDYGVAVKDASITNAYSIAATYGSNKKGLYLAGAYNNWDSKMSGVTNGVDDIKETRFVAQYKANSGLLANVMFQDFDTSIVATEGTNIQANIGYKMGKIMPKFKYSMVDYKSSTMNDGDAFAVGIDYSLGKKTTAKLDFVNYDKNIGANGKSSNLVSVGLLHKF